MSYTNASLPFRKKGQHLNNSDRAHKSSGCERNKTNFLSGICFQSHPSVKSPEEDSIVVKKNFLFRKVINLISQQLSRFGHGTNFESLIATNTMFDDFQ